MKIAEYQQMMDYLTGPREKFSNGGSVEGEKLISSLKKKKDSLGRPNISEYQEKLKILKEIQEKQYINPKTKKPFTPKEWLELQPSSRTKFRDPVTFLKKKREYQKAYMEKKKKDPKFKEKFLTKKKELYYRTERKKPKFTQIEKGYAALMEERNRLLNYIYMASKDNPNYKEIIKDGRFVGMKDKQNGVNYYEAGYEGKLGKNSKLITSHPNFKNTQDLLKLAREFKTSLPNKAISSYFSSYERVPTLAEMQNFLQADPRFVSKMSPQYFKTNPLHLHHQISMTESPTEKISLLLQDRNDQAGKKMIEFKKGNITEKQLNSDLKKLNTRYYINNKPIGAEETLPKTQLKTAKTQVTKLFNKRLAENPKLIEEMTKILGIVGCGSDRLPSQTGGNPTQECIARGAEKINNPKLIKKGAEARNAANFLNKAAKIGRTVMKFGVIPEAIFVAGESLVRMGMGDTLSESLLRASDYLLPGNQTKMADKSKFERTVGPENALTIMRARDYKNAQTNLQNMIAQRDQNQMVLDDSEFGYTSTINSRDQLTLDNERIKKAQADLKAKFQPEAVTDKAAALESDAIDIAGTNNIFKKIGVAARNAKVDDIETLAAPEQQQKGTAPPMLTNKDLADVFITDEFLQKEKDERFDGYAPEYTKENVLNFYRGMKPEELQGQDNILNQAYFQTVFGDARRSDANRERLFGTQRDFFGGTVEGRETPTNRFADFKLGMYAGGGIAKLAGKSSGPAPEKGPTSQGLAFFKNNGRKL
tara:strand:+ start:103 stop:2391 length:2289 start_codon:yes stop_codon:yes gene_type:complete